MRPQGPTIHFPSSRVDSARLPRTHSLNASRCVSRFDRRAVEDFRVVSGIIRPCGKPRLQTIELGFQPPVRVALPAIDEPRSVKELLINQSDDVPPRVEFMNRRAGFDIQVFDGIDRTLHDRLGLGKWNIAFMPG